MEATSVWSTRGVAPRQVAAFWSKALDEIMPGLQFSAIDSAFEACLRKKDIGGLCLNYVHATPQRIRTPSRPRSAASARFNLVYLKSGLLRVQQCARTSELRPGECVILDGAQYSEVVTCCESKSLNISVSASWLQQWLARPESEVAKPFAPACRAARPLLDFLDFLSEFEAPIGVGGDLIASQLGGALAIAVGEGEIVGTKHAVRLLNRLKEGICARYFDAGYCTQIAADQARISRRYLVSLFTLAGTTFNSELMRVRLERSTEMLRDPRFHSLSVMDIALRCGFSDASHFSKRFRAKYGWSPARYRQAHVRDAAPVAQANGYSHGSIATQPGIAQL